MTRDGATTPNWCEPTASEARVHALGFLRGHAIIAHHNGNGHEVTHLALLATDAVSKADDALVSEIRPEHLAWAMILPVFWLTNDGTPHASVGHGPLLDRLSAVDDAWRGMAKVLRVLWALMEDPLSVRDETRAELARPNLSWCCPDLDLEARVLLSLVVELLWQRDSRGALWKGAADALISVAKTALPSVSEHLRAVRRRLEIQHELLLADTDPAKMSPEGWGMDLHALAAADAWRGLLMCDWALVEGHLREMGRLDTWDSPLLVYATELARRTTGVRPTDTAANHALAFSRGQWARSRHGVAVCQSDRRERIRRLLGQLWSVGRADTGAADRFSVLRLIALQQVQALHHWDLLAWRDALSDQAEALAELLRFTEGPDLAATCIDLAVRSLSFDAKTPWWGWVIARWERGSAEVRSSTVRRLLSCRPVETQDALRALELLRDAIPEDHLPAVARWFGSPWLQQPSLRGFDRFPLGVWADILPYVGAQQDIARALSPALQTAVARAHWDSSSHSSVVAMWLGSAPSEEAAGLVESLLQRASEQPQDAEGIVWTLGVAAEGRAELRERFGDELVARARDPWCRVHLLDTLGWSESITGEDRTALKEWARGSILAYADSVLSRQAGRFQLGGRTWPPGEAVARTEWGLADGDVVERIASAIVSPQALDIDHQMLFTLLGWIADAASPDLLRTVERHVCDWLEEPPVPGGSFPLPGGPLSVFQARMPGRGEALRGFVALVRALRSRADSQLHAKIDDWVTEVSGVCPDPAIPVLASLLLAGAEDRHAPAGLRANLCLGLIDRLLARSHGHNETAKYLAEAVWCVDDPLVTIVVDCGPEGRALGPVWGAVVLSAVRLLSEAAHHPNPPVRQAVGGLLSHWEARAAMPPPVAAILEELRSDPRARVRYASRPCSLEGETP